MIRPLRHLARRLHAGESGSAMTEFVIGLPIFILIFGGMGMLYTLNHEALLVRAEANADLWANADATVAQASPVTGGGASIVGSIGDLGNLATNAPSALGIYVDSYSRAIIPGVVPGLGPRQPAAIPKWKISSITGSTGTFANALLNDLVNPTRSSGGFAGVMSSIVQSTGSGPGIAAGIRYGTVEGEAERTVQLGAWGEVELDPGTLHMPAPTAATHRLAAVALTRLTLDTVTPFDEPILEFNTATDTSGNQQAGEATACSEAEYAYAECISQQSSEMSQSEKEAACSQYEPDESCSGTGAQGPDFDISWCTGTFGC